MKYYIVEKTHQIQNISINRYFKDIFKEIEAYNLVIEDEKVNNPEDFIEQSKKGGKQPKYDLKCISKLSKVDELKDYIYSNINNLSIVKISNFTFIKFFIQITNEIFSIHFLISKK